MKTIKIDFGGTEFVLTSETDGDFSDLCQAISKGAGIDSVQLDNESSNWVDTWQNGELSHYYGKEPE